MLSVELNDYIYITLTDHISYALKLFDEGLNRPNALIWEIKKFYPKEFEIGLKALDLIQSETNKKLPEDEAGNIALHLINAQTNNSGNKVEDIAHQTKMIQDILNIIKYTYNIALNEKSLNYERVCYTFKILFSTIK